jgi:hypothetical protein
MCGTDDSIGVYDFTTSTFYLKNTPSSGTYDVSFKFGDKFGNPLDTNYYFKAIKSCDTLTKYNNKFYASYLFNLPLGPLVPISGDWDGDGKDSIGLYE